MMFGQLSNRESLRDLIVALEAHVGKVYHLGIGKSVTRSNLSKANEQRDYRIFEEFAFFMIAEARRRRIQKIFELDGHVYAFDSTTIDLCLSYTDNKIILGTGETPSTLRFYRSCGYRYSHRITNFFTDNYPNPIVEEEVTLRDMVYLYKYSNKNDTEEHS